VALWDLRRIIKDWHAAVWLLAMPLIFAFIFGNAFSGGGSQATWIPVIDLDRTELSASFIEQMCEEGYNVEIKQASDQAALKSVWPYGVVVPASFSENILKGQKVKVTVVKGTGGADRLLEVQACVTRAIVRLTTGLEEANICHRAWDDEARAALKAALMKPQLLTVTRKSDRGLRPPPRGFDLSLPGMLAMFVLQMVLTYGGATLLHDRVNGQFARLTMSPMHLREIFLGKVLSRIVLAMVQTGMLLVAGALLFGMQFGDHAFYLIPLVSAYAIFAGSLSVLGGVICETEKQVIQLAIFLSMILAALGGCWWSIEVVPDAFKTIAALTPTYWGMRGLQQVMYFNKSYQVLTVECPILLAFALACLTPAIFFARRLSSGKK
jgi:ABC-type multidrug transport system permease subunit